MDMIIREFTTPQDVFIIGKVRKNSSGYHGDLLVTDDYCSINVNIDDKMHTLETDGFVNILTRSEFNKHNGDFEEVTKNFLNIPNFKGMIVAHATVEDYVTNEKELEFTFKLDDYVYHQFQDCESEDVDKHVSSVTVTFHKTVIKEKKSIVKTNLSHYENEIKTKIIGKLQKLIDDYQKESDESYLKWKKSCSVCDNEAHLEAQSKSYALIEAMNIIEEEL